MFSSLGRVWVPQLGRWICTDGESKRELPCRSFKPSGRSRTFTTQPAGTISLNNQPGLFRLLFFPSASIACCESRAILRRQVCAQPSGKQNLTYAFMNTHFPRTDLRAVFHRNGTLRLGLSCQADFGQCASDTPAVQLRLYRTFPMKQVRGS